MAETSEKARPRVLVAIEPRSYSQTIGMVIGGLRPALEVRVVEPDNVLQDIDGHVPVLVLCSRPEPHDKEVAYSWIEFSPYADEQRVKVRLGKRWLVLEDADLNDLLSLVDEAVRSVEDFREPFLL